MMNYKVYSLVAALVGSLFLSSCKVDHGKPPVDKEEMISLLVDVHIAQSLMMREETIPQDKIDKNKYYKNVLDKHHVSEADFDSTVAWYARNPGDYKDVYQAVMDTLQARRNRMN